MPGARSSMVLLAATALLGSACREILGIEDLSFDLEGGGGTGAGGESAGPGGGGSAEGGGGGSTTSGEGGSGGGVVGCPAATAARSGVPTLWSSLDSAEAVVAPKVGFGAGSVIGSPSFVPALTDGGLSLAGPEQAAAWPAALEEGKVNATLAAGSLDVCLRPDADHDASGSLPIFAIRSGTDVRLALTKERGGALAATWAFMDAQGASRAGADAYEMAAGTWHRLSMTWAFEAGAAEVALYVDGVELVAETEGEAPPATPDTPIGFVAVLGGGADSHGTFDELVVYPSPVPP